MMMVLSVCAFYSSYPHLTLTDCTGTPKSECGDPAGVEDPTACGLPAPEASVDQQRCAEGVGSSTSEDDDYIATDSVTTAANVCEFVDSPLVSVMAERARGGRPDSSPEAWSSKRWHGDDGVDELADGQVVMYERESTSAEFVAGIIADDEQDEEACLKIDETYVETDFDVDNNDGEAVVEVVCETTLVETGGPHGHQTSPGAARTSLSQTESRVPGSCVVQLLTSEEGAGQNEGEYCSRIMSRDCLSIDLTSDTSMPRKRLEL